MEGGGRKDPGSDEKVWGGTREAVLFPSPPGQVKSPESESYQRVAMAWQDVLADGST